MQHDSKTFSSCRTILVFRAIAGSEWCIVILGSSLRICETGKYEPTESEGRLYVLHCLPPDIGDAFVSRDSSSVATTVLQNNLLLAMCYSCSKKRQFTYFRSVAYPARIVVHFLSASLHPMCASEVVMSVVMKPVFSRDGNTIVSSCVSVRCV